MIQIESNARNNKDTWKLAKWLFYTASDFFEFDLVDWEDDEDKQNECYDKAAELLKRISPSGIFS